MVCSFGKGVVILLSFYTSISMTCSLSEIVLKCLNPRSDYITEYYCNQRTTVTDAARREYVSILFAVSKLMVQLSLPGSPFPVVQPHASAVPEGRRIEIASEVVGRQGGSVEGTVERVPGEGGPSDDCGRGFLPWLGVHQLFVVFDEGDDVVLFEVGTRVGGETAVLQDVDYLLAVHLPDVHHLQNVAVGTTRLHAHVLDVDILHSALLEREGSCGRLASHQRLALSFFAYIQLLILLSLASPASPTLASIV
jgi:hypothetical protein